MNRRVLFRLVIVLGFCAIAAAFWLKPPSQFWLKPLSQSKIAPAFVGQWAVDNLDGKPASFEQKPTVTVRANGSVHVELAGHDELAADLDAAWVQKQFADFPPPQGMAPNAKITRVQIARKTHDAGRIGLRRID